MNIQSGYNIGSNTFGEIQLIFRDSKGNIVDRIIHHNIIKIFMKDHIAHTLPYGYKWDPTGGTSGSGDWVANTINNADLYFPKYIILGAAYDTSTANYGAPLGTNDTDFYQTDPVSGQKVPITLYSGANYTGGLIKAIPIDTSNNIPLKRIEDVDFDATYQPPGTPYLRDDVRALYNIVSFSTTLQTTEYNGFGGSFTSFDICELALVSGPAFDSTISDCNCDPHNLFLLGHGGNYDTDLSASPIEITLTSGSSTITLNDASDANYIYEGDQIKFVSSHSMITEYFMVLSKSGNQLTLDRVPKDDSNVNIPSGTYHIWVDRFRILAHSILPQPFSKTSALQVDITWKIYFS